MSKPNPKARPYPKNRAPRVDRSKMTQEEWEAHVRKKVSERCARWNARNPGKSYARLRYTRDSKPWWAPLLAAGDRSRKRGLEYTLTQDWAKQTYTGFCSLTGLPFILSNGKGKSGLRPYSPSLDRINPLEGYTPVNTRWVLGAVNSFKLDMSDAEMITIARALITNHRPSL